MFIPKEILQNMAMGIPAIKKIAWKRHTTGINNDPEKAEKAWTEIVSGYDIAAKTVLEIGPGRTDLLLKYARKSGAANVFALDVYPYLDTSELENTGIKYLVYNGQQMPFKNNSFDFIWSNDTFEHIRHPELTVSELSRILKPGAKVVLNIDLSDHYTKGMSESLLFKCLKYPGWLWKMMTGNRSAYVNRLRYSDWMHLIQKSGLKPIGENLLQSSEIRDLYRNKQIGYLKNLSEADAVTFYMSVVIEKPLS